MSNENSKMSSRPPSRDLTYMQLALKLAKKGGRAVAPNPMVGAVIVKNRKIIGKGYHEYFGGSHAEVNAIDSVKNPEDLKGAAIYVTLEPCRHYGKTPPCMDLIEKVGITRIICGSRDPYCHPDPALAGEGSPTHRESSQIPIEYLKGILAQKCRKLNKFFFTWIEKKRPFITVKIAMSADGFIADPNGEQIKFTSLGQDKKVHRMRAEHMAIMVGINTVLNDDPSLTVRHIKGKDPLRIILDSNLRVPKNAKVLKDDNYLIVTACASELKLKTENLKLKIWLSPAKNRVSLKKLFRHLADIGISSILVEPGPTLYRSLKKEGLIDELVIFRGKKKIRKGIRISL